LERGGEKMKFYKLLNDFNGRKNSLVMKIHEQSLEFNRYDTNKGIFFERWNENIKISFIRKKEDILDDYVVNDLAWFIVSDKLKKLLEEFELKKVQFLRLNAISDDGNEKIDNIYLCNIYNLSGALNLEYSKYFGSGEDIRIVKYALNEKEIDNYDIFRLKKYTSPIFISERVMKEMKKSKITGCDFGYVKMV
jgi:hypothetical protein